MHALVCCSVSYQLLSIVPDLLHLVTPHPALAANPISLSNVAATHQFPVYSRADLLRHLRPTPPAETEVLQCETEVAASAEERHRLRLVHQPAAQTALQLAHVLWERASEGGEVSAEASLNP